MKVYKQIVKKTDIKITIPDKIKWPIH